jgi:hypothetical protein
LGEFNACCHDKGGFLFSFGYFCRMPKMRLSFLWVTSFLVLLVTAGYSPAEGQEAHRALSPVCSASSLPVLNEEMEGPGIHASLTVHGGHTASHFFHQPAFEARQAAVVFTGFSPLSTLVNCLPSKSYLSYLYPSHNFW